MMVFYLGWGAFFYDEPSYAKVGEANIKGNKEDD
jgi:hypothetical protein